MGWNGMENLQTWLIETITAREWSTAIVARSTLLLSIGMLLSQTSVWRLRRQPRPAVGHVILTVTCLGLFAIPIGLVAPPAWQVAVRKASPMKPPVTWTSSPPGPVPIDDATISDEQPRDAFASRSSEANRPIEHGPAAESLPPSENKASQPIPIQHLGQVLLWGYVVGLLIGLLRIGLAWRWLSVATRAANSVATDLPVSLPSHVRLCASRRIEVPLVWGIFRPTILVPTSFGHWPTNRQRAVVLHELAHVCRRDAWWDLLVALATTVFWWHPLVHLVSRAHRRFRELAADALVIRDGEEPATYAGHLLESVVEPGRDRSLAASFVRSSSLKNRIRTLLLRPLPSSRLGRSLVTSGVLAGVLALTTVGVSISVAKPALEPLPAPEWLSARAPLADRQNPIEIDFQLPADQLPIGWHVDRVMTVKEGGRLINSKGRVMDQEGRPIQEAIVLLRAGWTKNQSPYLDQIYGIAFSDRDGRFRFQSQPVPRATSIDTDVSLIVLKRGYAVSWRMIDPSRAEDS
ncbi:MAG: M56 family metallopeptidase, partial [Planctomycetota bacterium]